MILILPAALSPRALTASAPVVSMSNFAMTRQDHQINLKAEG